MSPQKLQIHFNPFSINLMNGLTYARQSLHLTMGFYPKLTDATSSPYKRMRTRNIFSYSNRITVWFDNDSNGNCGLFLQSARIWYSISGNPENWAIWIEFLQASHTHTWSLLNLLLLLSHCCWVIIWCSHRGWIVKLSACGSSSRSLSLLMPSIIGSRCILIIILVRENTR